MTEISKISVFGRWIPAIFNVAYRLALLAVLVWIGFGLQDVASAIYGGGDACMVEPDANSGDDNAHSGAIKPLLRGAT